MYKHIFELIDGVAFFPVLALLIFFTFFMLVIMWLIRMDRRHVRYMEEMPLDHPMTSPNNGGNIHG